MPEVNVEINGKKYRMACEPGQEQHLQSSPTATTSRSTASRARFGEIGDNRLTVMAGIAILDELVEAERRIAQLKQDVANLTRAGEDLSQEAEEIEARFAKQLLEASRRLEAVATAIDEVGAA